MTVSEAATSLFRSCGWLRASLLQAFFTIRSERQLMEQLSYNLLLRWFVGLPVEAEVWDVTVFTKNRDRLLEGDVAHEFLRAVLAVRRCGRCCRMRTSRWMAR